MRPTLRHRGLAETVGMGFLPAMLLLRRAMSKACLSALLAGAPLATQPSAAQSPPEAPSATAGVAKPAPYDARLLRMAEILGSVTYLRTICGDAGAGQWRSDMQALIDREAGTETERKARLTAAYNRGFRSFAAVYTLCTPSAVLADQRYRDEGATLAAEIVSRFGN